MKKTNSEGPVAWPQPDNIKLRKLEVRLGNLHVRQTKRNRLTVMRALKQVTFGKASSVSYWDRWSKDEMKRCFLQLQPVSEEMANDFRCWAFELLKTGSNNKLMLKCLMDELEVRTWMEDPKSGL